MKTNLIFKAVAMSIATFTINNLYAQTDNEEHDEHHLEEIIVTGVLQKQQKDTALPVNVLSGDELRENAASTIGDSLQSQIGVNSASFGVGVGQPVVRGQSANRVQVLQNGTGALDVSNTSQDHANTVEALLAERIEVIRGPATLLYGNGAIGGVVNVIDNRIPNEVPESLNGAVEYRYNDVNDGSTFVAALNGGSGNFAWHIDGIIQDTDNVDIPGYSNLEEEGHEEEEGHAEEEEERTFGFIDNSNTEKTNLTVGGSYVTDSGFVGISINQLNNEYGLPPGAHEEEEEVIRLDMEQTRIDVKTQYDLSQMGGNWKNISATLTSNDYSHIELEGEETGTVFDNQGLELRASVSHGGLNDALNGSIGFQLVQRDFEAIGEEAFIPASDINGFGAYIIESIDSGDFTYEGGLRFDTQNVESNSVGCDVDKTSISASLASIWNFNSNSNVLISLNRSQRAPAVEELFSNIGMGCVESSDPENFVEHAATGRLEIGDPDLDKETATNIEVAYRKHSGRIRGEVSAFVNSISDYIYLADVGEFEETIVSRYLQNDARFVGAEVELDIPIRQWSDDQYFDLHLFADHVEAELDGGDSEGVYIPRIPPTRAGLELSYAMQDWRFKLRNTWVSAQRKSSINETQTSSYSRLDLFADYHFHYGDNEILLFARGRNLTDEEIRNHTSFLKNFAPEPGRSLEIGVRYQF